MNFNQNLRTQLAPFLAKPDLLLTTAPNVFSTQTGTVAFFVGEIEQTAAVLSRADNAERADFYADKLLRQFKTLQNAFAKANQKRPQNRRPQFQVNYRFPRNLHNLPVERRLVEYKKALRILNEKISWLMEQNYAAQTVEDQTYWQMQIQETEYRKQKCLAAIEQLT